MIVEGLVENQQPVVFIAFLEGIVQGKEILGISGLFIPVRRQLMNPLYGIVEEVFGKDLGVLPVTAERRIGDIFPLAIEGTFDDVGKKETDRSHNTFRGDGKVDVESGGVMVSERCPAECFGPDRLGRQIVRPQKQRSKAGEK